MKRLLPIVAFILLAWPAIAADPAGTGRVVLALGVCNDALVSRPLLLFRDAARKEHRRLSPPFFGDPDYKDGMGGFSIIVRAFPAGEWELYNHEMTSRHIGETWRHKSRVDYSHRFIVEPGKLVDLGRFCAASQGEGETYEDAKDEVFNTKVRFAYFVLSANREEDVERARRLEGDAAPLEVVQARPRPDLVSRLLKGKFVEPRMILKAAPPRPLEFPR